MNTLPMSFWQLPCPLIFQSHLFATGLAHSNVELPHFRCAFTKPYTREMHSEKVFVHQSLAFALTIPDSLFFMHL